MLCNKIQPLFRICADGKIMADRQPENISLSDNAYDALAALKGRDKSFSDIVLEIAKKIWKEGIIKFFR
ncbi:MAG: antitoxin VapB family protein [Candidatus Thermoplasmatota archaeon]|nr:antitoxin VapB family protein [Candidatus Thermoplasmatota archaeon]